MPVPDNRSRDTKEGARSPCRRRSSTGEGGQNVIVVCLPTVISFLVIFFVRENSRPQLCFDCYHSMSYTYKLDDKHIARSPQKYNVMMKHRNQRRHIFERKSSPCTSDFGAGTRFD